jgi:DNA-binding Lrp family transcriptional regulator
MNVNLDEIDRKILDELYRGAEKSQKNIAISLGISEPNLSKRIGVMRETGLISKFTVDINYDALGYDTNSITFIKLNDQHKNKLDEIISDLKLINEAVEVFTVFGNSDIYVRWIAASNANIMSALNLVLQRPEVAKVETVTLAQTYKRERGPWINRE